MGVGGVAPGAVLLLLPHVAADGYNKARLGVQNRNGGAGRVVRRAGHVQIRGIRVDGVRLRLNHRVHGGVNLIAALVQGLHRVALADALFLRKVRRYVVDNLVHKPRVVLTAVLRHYQIRRRTAAPLHEVQFLRYSRLVLLPRQVAQPQIRVIHPLQNDLLPLLVQFPRGGLHNLPVVLLLLHRDGGHGAVHGGVVGDGDEAGALGGGQVLRLLPEVELRRRLYAVTALAEVNRVQVQFQYLILFVLLLELQRPEDLTDFPLYIGVVVLGDVFQHLLGNRGAAEGVLRAGEGVHHGPRRPPPVHALVLEKAVVLNGDCRLPQAGGHVVERDHHAVLLLVQRLVHYPPVVLRHAGVLVVDHGGLGKGVVVHVHLDDGNHLILHVAHEEHAENHRGTGGNENHREHGEDRRPNQFQQYQEGGEKGIAPLRPAAADARPRALSSHFVPPLYVPAFAHIPYILS